MEGLTEGRIVHFVVSPEQHRAAIVVNIRDRQSGTCDLFVFSMPQDERGGFFMYTEAKYDDSKAEDTWHWIEKA
jgi:hypothetical protein